MKNEHSRQATIERVPRHEKVLRAELVALLKGGQAHLTFEDAIAGFDPTLRGHRPRRLPHSGWELLEHLRIAQHDILQFIVDPHYESPPWPQGYWPTSPGPPSAAAWDESVEAYLADRQAVIELIEDSRRDLAQTISHGQGQTFLREAMLIADHDAYHLGQLVQVRRLLGDWRI